VRGVWCEHGSRRIAALEYRAQLRRALLLLLIF
jgi:hypothetical protein